MCKVPFVSQAKTRLQSNLISSLFCSFCQASICVILYQEYKNGILNTEMANKLVRCSGLGEFHVFVFFLCFFIPTRNLGWTKIAVLLQRVNIIKSCRPPLQHSCYLQKLQRTLQGKKRKRKENGLHSLSLKGTCHKNKYID